VAPPSPTTFAICVPTLGRVNIRWVKQTMNLRVPMNTTRYDSIVTAIGLSVDEARNRIVRECLAIPSISHLLWLDDDVLVDPMALCQLYYDQRDIVAGYYYTKNPTCPEPLVLEQRSGGVRTSFDGGIIPVYAHGMGLTLIRRHVFETIEPPWFQTVKGGQTAPHEITDHTEDTYFCARAAEHGFTCHVDTSTFGFHWDEDLQMASPWQAWRRHTNGEPWDLPGHTPRPIPTPVTADV
jgi:hypothetical protein